MDFVGCSAIGDFVRPVKLMRVKLMQALFGTDVIVLRLPGRTQLRAGLPGRTLRRGLWLFARAICNDGCE